MRGVEEFEEEGSRRLQPAPAQAGKPGPPMSWQMQVYVNAKPVELFPGMTVKHALVKTGLLPGIAEGLKVYDEWGNELGLAGALAEGMKIWVR